MGKASAAIVQDTIAAGAGTDTLVVVGTGDNARVTVNLSSTSDQYGTGATQTGFENVDLSSVTVNGITAYTITAVSSGSQIAGSQGPDTITGGDGNDSVYGYYGNDTITGGAGNDTLFLINNASNVTSSPFQANAAASSNVGTLVAMTGIENVTITGNAPITVSFANQVSAEPLIISAAGMAITYLSGSMQSPTSNITGGAGADTITGSSLADTIAGGAGADIINVGSGTDRILIAAIGDSGTFTAPATNTISTTTFDIVTGMGAGDSLALALYTGTAAATAADNVLVNAIAAAGSTLVGVAPGANAVGLVRGTYDASLRTFVGDSSGTSMMVVYDANPLLATTAYEAIILVGSGANTASVTAGTGGLIPLGG